MKLRTIAYAAVALAALVPGVGSAGIFAKATVSAVGGSATAGATVNVTCWAEGSPTGGMSASTTTVDSISVSVTGGGTVTPTTFTGATTATCSGGAGTCSVLTGTAAWATTTTPGSLVVTCTANGTTTPSFGSPYAATYSGTATLTTVASSALPPTVSAITGPAQMMIGEKGTFTATASDPNVPPQALTPAWTATGGTVAGSGTSATWTAPNAAGAYTLTLTVTNASGQATTATATVNVVLGAYQGALTASMSIPRRIATDAAGNVYAVDAGSKSLLFLTAKGELMGAVALADAPLAVGAGTGVVFVATGTGRLLEIDPASARVAREVTLADGPLYMPWGVAYEPVRNRLWLVERASDQVRVIARNGTTAFTIRTAAAGIQLTQIADVAVDAAGSRVWVILENGSADGNVAHAFDLDGNYKTSALARAVVSRAGGIAVDSAGQIYVSDAYQGDVKAFTASGVQRGTYGTWGDGPGQLRTPSGLGILRNGNLLVANLGSGRIERFGTVSALPTCAGDTDCDGLPDWWEAKYGLSSTSPLNGLLDTDGDGLTNLQEFKYGTDPTRKDSPAPGFDPQNPSNPQLIAKGPGEVGPGLVQLTSSVVGGTGTCTVGWSQYGGPEVVTLRGSPGPRPSFVGRKPGAYSFKAKAQCGQYVSGVSTVQVTVRDVPPLVAVDGIRVVAPGTPLALDASRTGDGNETNASVLRFAWDQMLGPPLAAYGTGALLSVQTGGAGYHEFAVTATDPAGNAASGEVPVLVASGPTATVAVSTPLRGEIGSRVMLDAAGSFVPRADSTFVWEQVAGPATKLETNGGAFARFVPGAAGRYAFQVFISSGGLRSPPGRIDVYVPEAGATVPVAAIAKVDAVEVGTPARLDGTGSSGGAGTLAYAWRQVSGPVAGIDDPASATPTVLPFAAGSHEFELVVAAGAAEGPPARVRFDAVVKGQASPVAVARRGSGVARVGDVVVLDGTGSRGAEKFHWTQVAGPWVALDDASSPAPSFKAPVAARYAFELVVERAGVRSAPSTVKVVVGGEK